MKTKTDKITPLVRKLKRLNATCEQLRTLRDATPNRNPFSPSRDWQAIMRELNDASGNAMHTERQIITALLAQLK